jgi:glucokinase
MLQKVSFTLGVDLGGTKVKTALVDNTGRIVSEHKYPTQAKKGVQAVISDIVTCINECLDKSREKAQALGIGVAGQVTREGRVQYAPNLNWRNVSLKEILETKLGLPVVVINDVRAATWGEWCYGSGKGVRDLVVLFIGTGIGGGVLMDEHMIEGCSNTGGELGHMTIVTDGRKCHCPNSGCLEAYAGGWAIAERAQIAVEKYPQAGQELIALAGKIDTITAATVTQSFREGGSFASRLVQETVTYLSAGVVSIVNAFNPCLIVLGGGVIEGLPQLVEMVEKKVKRRALTAATEGLRFVKATLGDNAGVVGAAVLARDIIIGIP